MTDKPWLKQYGPSVPHEVSAPTLTLDAVFDRAVQRYPTRAATIFTAQAMGRLFSKSMTYAEIDEQSDRLAVAFQKRGIQCCLTALAR